MPQRGTGGAKRTSQQYRRRTNSSTNSKIGKGSRLAGKSGMSDISGISYLEEDERASRLSLGILNESRDSLAKPKRGFQNTGSRRPRSQISNNMDDDQYNDRRY